MLTKLFRAVILVALIQQAGAVDLRPLQILDEPKQPAWQALYLLRDPGADLTLNDIKDSLNFKHLGPQPQTTVITLNANRSLNWQRWGKPEIPSFGYQEGIIWALLPLRNSSDEWINRLVSIEASIIDEVDIFVFTKDSQEQHYRGGNLFSPSKRLTLTTVPSAVVVLPPQSNGLILFRMTTETAVHWPVNVWQSREFSAQQRSNISFEMLFYGLILSLVISQLTHYFINRNTFTLWYALSGISIVLFFMSISGTGTLYLWGELGGLARDVIVYCLIFMFVATSGLGIQVMNIKGQLPRAYPWLRGLQFFAFAWLLFLLLFGYSIAVVTIMVYAAVVCLGFTVVAARLWRRGSREGKYYLISWTPFFLSGALFMLSKIGVAYWEPVIARLMQFAAVFQLIVYFYYQSSTFAEQTKVLLEKKDEALALEKNYSAKLQQEVDDQSTALSRANEQLQQLNTIDALSGAYNRRFFNLEYPREIKRAIRQKSVLSLLVIDIDRFTRINDLYGHLSGDKAIRQLSEVISSIAKRDTDWIARFNADRFVVILPHTPLTYADQLAEKIANESEQLKIHDKDGNAIDYTICIGISSDLPSDEHDPSYLLEQAEQALILAKRRGAGRIWIYEKDPT